MPEESGIGGVPYGNAFIIQTPHIDQLTQQLQQQAADRRSFQQKDMASTDDMMNRELSNVRSVDMPQVTDLYNQYKQLSMQGLFDRSVINNPMKFNQLQQQKNALLGQLQTKINQSAELNSRMKEMVTERKMKPNLFADNFGDLVNQYNSTPMDKLIGSNLTNPDTFGYQTPQTNFASIDKASRGDYKPVMKGDGTPMENVDKVNDFQSRNTPVLFGNSPLQYFQNYAGSLAPRVANRDAAYAWEKLPDAEKMRVDQLYSQIGPDKWQYMSPDGKPQVISPADPSDPAQNFAAYQAKLYAINAASKAGTPRMVMNQEGKMTLQNDLTEKRQLAVEALRQNDRVALKGYAHQLSQMDQAGQDVELDKFAHQVLSSSSGPISYDYANGGVVKQRIVDVSPGLKKILGYVDDKGHTIYPDQVRVSEDESSITPIFWQRDSDGQLKKSGTGNIAINGDLSKPMTMDEFKQILKKQYFGVKGPTPPKNTTTTRSSSGITWQ